MSKKHKSDKQPQAAPEAATATATPPAPAGPKPDTNKIDENGLAEAPFPAEMRREFRVLFDESVHAQVLAHASETVDVELCGVLLGRLKKDKLGPYLTITAAIRGDFAQNDGAQVKFTHATWDHIHKVKEEKFPDLQIVGWYHTHPGFGIFLSSMDSFIQEFFFNSPQQIAHVIDPRTGEEGIFTWEGGGIDRARRFWIGSRERACATGAPATSRPRASMPAGPAVSVSTSAPSVATPIAGTHDDGRPEEWDVLGGLAKIVWQALPLLVAIIAGFFLGRVYALSDVQSYREELLREQVRELVGSAALEMSVSTDLRALERRVERSLAAAKGTPAEAELQKTLDAIASLESSSAAREELVLAAFRRRATRAASIEDDLDKLARESMEIRRLAIPGYLLAVKLQLEELTRSGRKLAPEQRDLLKLQVEDAIRREPAAARERLQAQFPELFAPQPDAPAGPAGPPSSEKK